jgi:hypothetical protein
MASPILKRASASRPSGEWDDHDFDVFADDIVVGRIMKAAASPEVRRGLALTWDDPYSDCENHFPGGPGDFPVSCAIFGVKCLRRVYLTAKNPRAWLCYEWRAMRVRDENRGDRKISHRGGSSAGLVPRRMRST